MSRFRFHRWAALFACALGCNRQPVGSSAAGHEAAPSAAAAPGADAGPHGAAVVVDAAAAAGDPNKIGETGGSIEAAGVRLSIPRGALIAERAFSIQRVTAEALADWPKGTQAGFTFAPAGERFRVPVTIELPHDVGEGQVICESAPPDQLVVQFEVTPKAKRFAVHVLELPRRCAVYTPRHARAFKTATDRAAEKVGDANRSFKWEMKGKVCDPRELVRPNAGKVLREPPGIGGCPAGMAPIPGKAGVCIDRWEAHSVEILEDGAEHTWSPYFNPGSIRIRAKSAPNAVPQGYISQVQSKEACRLANKRLCRDDEWLSACRGSKGWAFPYGNDEHLGTCNDHRDQHPASQYLESTNLSVFTKLEHPCINQVADSVMLAGAKKSCTTPEGVADLVGNLHEWTADASGNFRGGYYVETQMNGRGCDYVTTAHDPSYWDYSTGFRCCADAKGDAGTR